MVFIHVYNFIKFEVSGPIYSFIINYSFFGIWKYSLQYNI